MYAIITLKSFSQNKALNFICYKKEEMALIEEYYDEILNIQYIYINSYLAYKNWKTNYIKLNIPKNGKMLLTVAASKYILYNINNEKYNSEKEYKKLIKELKRVNKELKIIIEKTKFFS